MDFLSHLAIHQVNQAKNILRGFQKGEQPREGEIRHWKDGDYKLEGGHWKKQLIPAKGEDILEYIKYSFANTTDEQYKKLYKFSKEDVIKNYENKSRENLKQMGITDKEKFINEIKEAVKIDLKEGELQTIFNKLDDLLKHGKKGDSVAYYNEMKSRYKDFESKVGEHANKKRKFLQGLKDNDVFKHAKANDSNINKIKELDKTIEKLESIVGNKNLDQIKKVMDSGEKENREKIEEEIENLLEPYSIRDSDKIEMVLEKYYKGAKEKYNQIYKEDFNGWDKKDEDYPKEKASHVLQRTVNWIIESKLK